MYFGLNVLTIIGILIRESDNSLKYLEEEGEEDHVYDINTNGLPCPPHRVSTARPSGRRVNRTSGWS